MEYVNDKIKFLLDVSSKKWYNFFRKEGVFMETIRTISSIKKSIEGHLGEKVTLKANGGRKKILVNDGVLESAYPSIFVIRLDNDTQRTVTYSYSDVLTQTVQLHFPG
ncbi:veg protein [Clostridium baratii]|nr:veg protein [Clostridium baratii]